jgi:GNAT superfamily N-acetyltransferase
MERPLYDSSRLKDFAAMGSILEERVRDVSTNEMLHSIARRKEHQDCLGNAGRPYFVANDSDGRVLGGLGLDDVEEDLLPFIETDKPMEVVNAFVTNDHRGQGVGKQFLTEVQKYAVEHG